MRLSRHRLALYPVTAFCLSVASARVSSAAGSPSPPELVSAAGQPVLSDESGDPTVVRTRTVRVDLDLLASMQTRQRVGFNLFDDASFIAVFETSPEQAPDRATWAGRIEGEPQGTFTLALNQGAVAAIIRVPGLGVYRIRSVGEDAHVVQEIDETSFPPCGNGPEHAVLDEGGIAAGGECDDGSTIDVLVVYTPLARTGAGGTAAIRAEIDLSVAITNDSYENSVIAPRLSLVHETEVDYDEDGSYSDHLVRLTNPNDGFMDEVHAMRDEYQADMVALLVADNDFCGQAWLMTELSPDFEDRAFSVTTWFCAAGGLTFAHELGHNQGCCHARGDGGGCTGGGLFDYSVGHRFFGNSGTQWRTVMAYSPGSRIRYFSNPDVSWDGQPVGVPSDDPLGADNALTINQTALVISQFRCSIPPCVEGKLAASDSGEGDRFGYSVGISGDLAVAGADSDDDNGSGAGAAYAYRFDGSAWGGEVKLMASDGAADDRFGRALAISGNAVVVGAFHDDDNGSDSGSAYVFRFEDPSWSEEAKLVASDGAPDDLFGKAVAISGQVAIVGAEGRADNGTGSGAAYLYRFDPDLSQWGDEVKLVASDGEPDDAFGVSVGITGEVAVVGAPGDDDNGSGSGAVYVFRFDGSIWNEEAKLAAFDGEGDDRFGTAVAISGDVIIVGAHHDDDNGENAGAAYAYRFNGSTWEEQGKLVASDGVAGDFFGRSVAVSGNVALLGAYGVDDNGIEAGAMYVYRRGGSTWNEEAKLGASDDGAGDRFGFAVALSGDAAIVGAFADDDAGSSSGSAEIFAGPVGFDCNQNGLSDICDISYGTSLDENGNGIPDECDCPWDLDDSGTVDIADLLELLANWGTPGPGDFDSSGMVDIGDLLTLLANWGLCS
ncbi:MAG: M12 family metallo-peptidase [Planctomycetota bacterium]|jgi:hypothetical protein